MSKSVVTKDLGNMIMGAFAKGFVTRTNLRTLTVMLPEMKTTFSGALDVVYEMTEELIKKVDDLQTIIPTNGSFSEGAASQAMVEMVKTGSAMIRKVTGVVEEAI